MNAENNSTIPTLELGKPSLSVGDPIWYVRAQGNRFSANELREGRVGSIGRKWISIQSESGWELCKIDFNLIEKPTGFGLGHTYVFYTSPEAYQEKLNWAAEFEKFQGGIRHFRPDPNMVGIEHLRQAAIVLGLGYTKD